MSDQSYPLAWPQGWKRGPNYRASAGFRVGSQGVNGNARKLTVNDGVRRVIAELVRMGVRERDVTISTNMRTGLSSSTGSQLGKIGDPGVAVYWKQGDKPERVLAVDRYDTVADNLAAIAATLDAMRAIERHGGAVVLNRAMEGLTALPAPPSERPWWQILGLREDATIDQIKAAHREGVKRIHPDAGGSGEAMALINRARDIGLQARTLK